MPIGRRRMPGCRDSLPLLIGTALGLSQPAVAQLPVLQEVALADRDLRQQLLDRFDRGADLAVTWGRCADVGPALAPLLWELAKGARRRLPLLVAFALASPGTAAEDLLRVAESAPVNSTGNEERVAALLLLAIGPEVPAGLGDPWPKLLPRGRASAALLVAGYAAASRWPPGQPGEPTPTEDPGVLAAALLAGHRGADKALEPYFQLDRPPPFAELVWRGCFLGRLRDDPAAVAADRRLVARARDVLLLPGPQFERARAAAALLLGHAGVDVGGSPPWQLLQLLAATPAGAGRQLLDLQPLPPLAEDPRRLAAEFALFQPLEVVARERDRYAVKLRRVEGVRDDEERARQAATAVALALAWRLLEPGTRAACPPALLEPLATVPEWAWVQWAAGAPLPEAAPSSYPPLAAALPLARDGRLPAAAARELLEQAMWCLGCHPGLGREGARLELLRDLLVTGSHPGTKYSSQLDVDARYQPSGLQRTAPMFDVLVALFDYLLSQPRLPLPRECRLR